jgi:GntR family transcriptional repressor for pyruvate dehydrogenase complex
LNLPDDKVPVGQAIARQLQDMIRSGELKPGERIPSQRTLSVQLNVSRPSLREALLTLETLGLVRTLPARGTYVAEPGESGSGNQGLWRYDDKYSLRDVFQTRLLIESELCRLCAGARDEAALLSLEKSNTVFEEAWKEGDLMAHVDADLRFHRTIAEGCSNRMLLRLYHSVQELLSETQRQPIPNTEPARMVQSIAEHRNIITALRRGDAGRASEAMHVHIRNTASCAGVEGL